ncbi:uncharacterized protein ACJ7VT_007690 [Polymixia lowei]
MFRALVNERLTAAVEDICGVFERTITEYEAEVSRLKEETSRQQNVLDAILNPEIRLNRIDSHQFSVCKEEVPPEQQEWSPSLCQEEPDPPHIKDEQEELIQGLDEAKVSTLTLLPEKNSQQISACKEELSPEQQEWSPSLCKEEPEPPHIKEEQEEPILGLEEAEVPTLTLLPEQSENNEEEQSSQLNPTQTEENREAEHLASTSTEQMKTEPDGQDSGVSHPASDLKPTSDGQPLSSDCCETETEDSDDDWKESREPQSSLNTLKANKTQRVEGQRLSVSNNLRRSVEPPNKLKPVSCSLCSKTFSPKTSLKLHMRTHTAEKPFSCSLCGKKFTQKGGLQSHMRIHTGEKPFRCLLCTEKFTQKKTLNAHMICAHKKI